MEVGVKGWWLCSNLGLLYRWYKEMLNIWDILKDVNCKLNTIPSTLDSEKLRRRLSEMILNLLSLRVGQIYLG